MPDHHDPAVPIKHGKWEIVSQRLAMGDSQAQAGRAAGYKSSDMAHYMSKLVKKHPFILSRAQYLRERMFDRQVDTKLITRDEVITGLKATIEKASGLSKPQLGVVHSCLRTLAEMEGYLVKKSEIKKMKDDPFEDASREQLVNMIERAAKELEVEVDGKLLQSFLDSTAPHPSRPNGGDADQEAGVLQALPEGPGIS